MHHVQGLPARDKVHSNGKREKSQFVDQLEFLCIPISELTLAMIRLLGARSSIYLVSVFASSICVKSASSRRGKTSAEKLNSRIRHLGFFGLRPQDSLCTMAPASNFQKCRQK
ncbi:hypothetical protein FRC03_012202 [Tulasnella sp. 419]|nr:hypothetical protein FRC03_012202 [Tulasnella sp. 419]